MRGRKAIYTHHEKKHVKMADVRQIVASDSKHFITQPEV